MLVFLFKAQLCLTPECITLAADTYNAMDPTVDPCEVCELLKECFHALKLFSYIGFLSICLWKLG